MHALPQVGSGQAVLLQHCLLLNVLSFPSSGHMFGQLELLELSQTPRAQRQLVPYFLYPGASHREQFFCLPVLDANVTD